MGQKATAAGLSLVAAAVMAAAAPAAADTTGGPAAAGTCARDFDRAIQQYVDTTDRRDAAGFNALLDQDVTAVLRLGDTFDGKREVATFIEEFFAEPGWTQSFTVLKKVVHGCHTAFVLYDSVYADPGAGVRLHLIIGVTFTHRHGRWLIVHNQDSGAPIT